MPSYRLAILVPAVALAGCGDLVNPQLGSRLHVSGERVHLLDCSPGGSTPRDTAACGSRLDTLELRVDRATADLEVTHAGVDTTSIGVAEHWTGEGEVRIERCPGDEPCATVFHGIALTRLRRLDARCVSGGNFAFGPCDDPDGRAVLWSFDVMDPAHWPGLLSAVNADVRDGEPIEQVTGRDPRNSRQLVRMRWQVEHR